MRHVFITAINVRLIFQLFFFRFHFVDVRIITFQPNPRVPSGPATLINTSFRKVTYSLLCFVAQEVKCANGSRGLELYTIRRALPETRHWWSWQQYGSLVDHHCSHVGLSLQKLVKTQNFRFYRPFHYYLYVTVVVFSVFANFIILIVLTHKEMRCAGVNVTMMFIAVCDFSCSIAAVVQQFLRAIE